MDVLPSGKIRYRTKVDGRRVSGEALETATKALASFRKAWREYEAERDGAPKKREIPRVRDWMYETLDGPLQEQVATDALSSNTWDLYELVYRTQVEESELGAKRLDEVTFEHVEEWAAGLVKTIRTKRLDAKGKPVPGPDGRPLYEVRTVPLPATSKRRYIYALSGFFERARLAKLIPANPVHDAKKPPETIVEFRILKKSEVRELLILADEWGEKHFGYRPDYERMYPMAPRRARLVVLLGLHGLGVSEMCGLRTMDFAEGGFFIRRQDNRGEIKTSLKTEARRAWIPADPQLTKLVESLPRGPLLASGRALQKGAKRGTGAMSGRNVQRLFASLVKGTAFEDMRPYDLRHTFAMRLLEEGVDIRTAAELLRNSPEVFLKRYVRSNPELKNKAIARVDISGGRAEERRKKVPVRGSGPTEGPTAIGIRLG